MMKVKQPWGMLRNMTTKNVKCLGENLKKEKDFKRKFEKKNLGTNKNKM